MLRPGRFDRRVIMELPDLEGRKAIFKVHLKDVKHADIDLDAVGRATAGSSGADIANIYGAQNEAYKCGRDEKRANGLRDKGLGRLRPKRRKKRNVYMGLILVYMEGVMRLG